MYIPEQTRRILDEYYRPLSPDTPIEVLLLIHYVYISRMLCFNRVKIIEKADYLFPNIFALCFVWSGGGKDRSINFVEPLYKDVFDSHRADVMTYVKAVEMEIDSELDRAKNNEGKPKYTSAQKQKIREEKKPYTLIEEAGDGTVEGISFVRLEMQKAGFGSTHITNNEWVDSIAKRNTNQIEWMSFAKGAYEKGGHKVKVIKSQKEYEEVVNGIPCTMLAQSSLEGLVNNDKAMEVFNSSLGRGFARRSIICVPEQTEDFVTPSMEEEDAKTERALSLQDEFKGIINKIHDNTNPITYQATENSRKEILEYREFTLDDEVRLLHFEYRNFNKKQVHKKRKRLSESQKSERLDRHRRALRLSACIGAFEHPESLVITGEDYNSAVTQIEYFASQFNKIIYLERTGDVELLYNYIVNTQDEQKINKTKIKNQSFVPRGSTQATQWVNTTMPLLEDYCRDYDMELRTIKEAKNEAHYRIEPLQQQPPPDQVTLSFTKSTKPHPVEGYQPFEFKYSSLANNLMKGACYSPAFFRDGYRDTKHLYGHGNLVIIDIDELMSLTEATKTLDESRYAHLIITTENHQKPDKGDRYRVILPTATPLAPKHGYSSMMVHILKHLKLYDVSDLGATKDQVRYYKPSPKDAHVHYSSHTKTLNWEQFDIPPTTPTKKPYTPSKNSTLPRNAVPEAIFTDKSGKTYTWNDFEYLSTDETFPVRCINPENHKNGDKHPSAFVGRHRESGSLMHKCTACQTLIYNK